MKVTLLGTGDAIGTPKIGCSCPQCSYALTHGISRLRTSLLVEERGFNLLIDTSPDLRLQLLRAGSPHIDAVLWTHGHYDHYVGYGEFYRVQKAPPVYAVENVLDYCAAYFTFLSFERHPVVPHEQVNLPGLTITFFEVNHPPDPCYGIRVETECATFGFTADTTAQIPPASMDLLRTLDLLVIDAIVPPDLHLKKHMNYQEACNLASLLQPKTVRCVHLSHLIPWDTPSAGKDMESFTL